MVVARGLAPSVRAQREDVVEGAILRRARAQVSVSADKAEEGDAAAARAAGGASARAGGRAIRTALTLQKALFERELQRRREECAFGDKNSSKCRDK